MIRSIPLLLLITCLGVCRVPLSAQELYSGSRVALFDVKILEIKNRNLLFKCRIANTGRETVSANKPVLVELDTLNLPSLLWGLEPQIADAARSRMPRLLKGEISEPVWLELTAAPLQETAADKNARCADVQLDSVFLTKFERDEMSLRYILKNNGNQVVTLTGKALSTTVNVYFISGSKLTRGAIPAGAFPLQQGVETLTGQLGPGQKLAGELNFKLTNRTKFSPNILLELVLPGGMQACNLNRNTAVIHLE